MSTAIDECEMSPGTTWIPLQNVFLHVTKACNLRCEYCYFSADEPLPNEMTTAEFTALWPDVVAVSPQKVVFTGGEPLLRPDLFALLRGLKDADPNHRVLRCLNTNGRLITAERARELVGLADEVRVSLDAMPAENDALRGAGSFAAAMKALEWLHGVGFEPKVLITVTSVSLPSLEELLVHLFQRRLTRINFNTFRPIGRGVSRPELIPNELAVRQATLRAWRKCFPDLPTPHEALIPVEQSHCGVGRFVNVMPTGDVFPCHVLTESEFRCGNLRQQRFTELCRSDGLLSKLAGLDFREVARQNPGLQMLKQPGTCLGDIPARARLLTILSPTRNVASPNATQDQA